MKRACIISVTIIMLTVLCAGLLTACYPSKPAKLSDVVGTYELSEYTRTYNAEQEGEESVTHDMLAEKNIRAYLVIREDGTGYYVYQDDTHEVAARIVNIQYEYDDEDASLVQSIVYNAGNVSEGDGYPGKGKEHLGVYFSRKQQFLSFTMPAVIGRKYSQTVRYNKVSNDMDLSYASQQLDKTLTTAPYEVGALDGLHTLSGVYDETCDYIYFAVDLRAADRTATIYYATKASQEDIVLSDLQVRYDIPQVLGEDGYSNIRINVGNYAFHAYFYGTPVLGMMMGEQGDGQWLTIYSRDSMTVADYIAEQKQMYASSQEE